MNYDIKFNEQEDGSFELVVDMPEADYMKLSAILKSEKLTFQELMDIFFRETIRLKRLPFEVTDIQEQQEI